MIGSYYTISINPLVFFVCSENGFLCTIIHNCIIFTLHTSNYSHLQRFSNSLANIMAYVAFFFSKHSSCTGLAWLQQKYSSFHLKTKNITSTPSRTYSFVALKENFLVHDYGWSIGLFSITWKENCFCFSFLVFKPSSLPCLFVTSFFNTTNRLLRRHAHV